jgi:hypothetical protein
VLQRTGILQRRRRRSLRGPHRHLFEAHTRSTWRPRSGSKVTHLALTSALVDSRDFLAARRRAENEVLMPTGAEIAFAGGPDCNDHSQIWDVLDKAHPKHPEMVLLRGGSSKGAERIAACWAEARRIAQVVFKPNWTRHAKAAPLKPNDALLQTLPIGVIVFPGSRTPCPAALLLRRSGPAHGLGIAAFAGAIAVGVVKNALTQYSLQLPANRTYWR